MKQTERKALYGWLCLTALWCALIFWFSAKPADASSEQSGSIVRLLEVVIGRLGLGSFVSVIGLDVLTYLVRKTAHFTIYFVLGLLSSRSAAHLFSCAGVRRFFVPLCFCALYAASDELHQDFVPGRAAMWQDVLLDSSAAAVACALHTLAVHLHARKSKTICAR